MCCFTIKGLLLLFFIAMISIPFSGSKRYSYKNVREIARRNNYHTVYEPFGGSCVLSVNLLNDGLVKKAVVNDYDRFFDLYPKYQDLKDKVVEEGYKCGLKRTTSCGSLAKRFNSDGTYEIIKSVVLNSEDRKILQEIITEYVPEKYWKYFALGSNFTHSAVSSHKTIKLFDFSMFNRYLKTDKQRAYMSLLNRCTIEHLDWHDFLNKYSINQNDLIILDPPYINTAQQQYSGQFSLLDTVNLINTVKQLGCDFIFFNHDVDTVKELLDGIDTAIEFTGNANTSANHKRKDVMAYVIKDKRKLKKEQQLSYLDGINQ